MLREIFDNLKKTPEERQAAWEQALYKKLNNVVDVMEGKVVQALPKPDLLTQLHQDRDKMDRIQKHSRMGWDKWTRVHEQPESQEGQEMLLLECGRHPSKEVRLLECAAQQSRVIPLLGCTDQLGGQEPSSEQESPEQDQLLEFAELELEPKQYNRRVHGNRRNH